MYRHKLNCVKASSGCSLYFPDILERQKIVVANIDKILKSCQIRECLIIFIYFILLANAGTCLLKRSHGTNRIVSSASFALSFGESCI